MSKTLVFDTNNQPTIDTKGNTTNIAVPVWSRPYSNVDPYPGDNSFRARPIRHWRKQLFPRENSGSGKSAVGIPSDKPGGSVHLGNSNPCDNNINIFMLKENIINNDEKCCTTNITTNSKKNIIRSASTILNKNYYTDSRSYLKSRCKTYKQNLSGNINNNVDNYDENGNFLWPNENKDGPQVRNIDKNNHCDENKKCTLIYKPNNRNFATQGAVSSSERLVRLKLNTINKNGASFETAFGSQAANAGRYHGTSEAPYFIKDKVNNCKKNNFYRRGNHTTCFSTTTQQITNKMKL
tara:strand:- start:61 stop:945 length:885 start_codon:yes stop_codon:yes gene_type:complete